MSTKTGKKEEAVFEWQTEPGAADIKRTGSDKKQICLCWPVKWKSCSTAFSKRNTQFGYGNQIKTFICILWVKLDEKRKMQTNRHSSAEIKSDRIIKPQSIEMFKINWIKLKNSYPKLRFAWKWKKNCFLKWFFFCHSKSYLCTSNVNGGRSKNNWKKNKQQSIRYVHILRWNEFEVVFLLPVEFRQTTRTNWLLSFWWTNVNDRKVSHEDDSKQTNPTESG